nr:hypothetical protein [Tanacetum cinerariifolium]
MWDQPALKDKELKWLCLYSMYAAQDCECACCKSCTKHIALALEKVIPFVIR